MDAVLGNLLLTLVPLLGESLQSGDSDGQKLHDDGCGNIRGNRQSKQCCRAERTAGQRVEVSENGCRAELVGQGCIHNSGINKGDGHNCTDAIQDEDQSYKQKLVSDFGNLKSVPQSLKHFIPPQSFHLLLRSFP